MPFVHLSSKSRHKKAQLTEAQFGPVLNWASIAQSSSQTAVIEEVDVGVQQSWNILIRYNNFRKLKSKQKKTWFAALW